MRQTRTFVVLEISQRAYDEIKGKLKAAGYGHTFMKSGEIDMDGIALASEMAQTGGEGETYGGRPDRTETKTGMGVAKQ